MRYFSFVLACLVCTTNVYAKKKKAVKVPTKAAKIILPKSAVKATAKAVVKKAVVQKIVRSYPYLVTDKKEQMTIKASILKIKRRVDRVRQYTMIMVKRERVRGRLGASERLAMKFRKPFSIYMKWVGKVHKGRQLLYVKGANNGNIKVKDTSFMARLVGTVNLNPKGSMAMKGQRHDISYVGLHRVMKIIVKNMKRYEARNDPMQLLDEGKKGRIACVKMTGPKNSKSGYYAYRTRVCWDTKRMLPTRVQSWNWKLQMIEDYRYMRIRTNPRLTDLDFNPGNRNYKF